MNGTAEPTLQITLDRDPAEYEPAATLLLMCTAPATEARTIELSVLWFTEGKGDEDLTVVYFREWNTPEDLREWTRPVALSLPLPLTPHSYNGVLLRIHWEARLRMQPQHGAELRAQQRFRLGCVAPVSMPS
jgi:hypothetical protein